MSEHQKTLRYNNLNSCGFRETTVVVINWDILHIGEGGLLSNGLRWIAQARIHTPVKMEDAVIAAMQVSLTWQTFTIFVSFFFFGQKKKSLFVWLWNHSVNITDCVLCLSIFLLCLHSSLTSDFISLFSQLLSGTYVQADCDGTKKTECVGCGRGLYTATKNHLNKCQKCKECSRSKWHGCMHMQYCIAHKRHILTSFSSAFL